MRGDDDPGARRQPPRLRLPPTHLAGPSRGAWAAEAWLARPRPRRSGGGVHPPRPRTGRRRARDGRTAAVGRGLGGRSNRRGRAAATAQRRRGSAAAARAGCGAARWCARRRGAQSTLPLVIPHTHCYYRLFERIHHSICVFVHFYHELRIFSDDAPRILIDRLIRLSASIMDMHMVCWLLGSSIVTWCADGLSSNHGYPHRVIGWR